MNKQKTIFLYCPVSNIGFWFNHMAGTERDARKKLCEAMGLIDWRDAKDDGFRMARVKIEEI